MASAIETFSVLTNTLPSEAIFTAEFVEKMDCLFDSLNGFSPKPSNKIFRCALRLESPHIEFWSKTLDELRHWRICIQKLEQIALISFPLFMVGKLPFAP